MCGLVAVSSKHEDGFSADEMTMVEQSMIFNQLRGDDSTGGACIDNNDAWTYIKAVGGYKAFVRHQFYDDFAKALANEGRLFFGHGRWATRGNVTMANAHPFLVEDKSKHTGVLFMHNGTLDTYQTHLRGMYQYAVDSEFLANMIFQHGAEKALSEAEGAIACMWWDLGEKTFNFYHNKDRPLFFMLGRGGSFFLNSEKWILEYLNWKFKLRIPEKNIYAIQENKWHAVSINGDNAGTYKIKAITSKPKPVIHYRGAENGYYSGLYDYNARVGERVVYAGKVLPTEDKEFWDRSIETIEWYSNKEVITYRDKRVTVHVGKEPPEPDLLRMYEIKDTGDKMVVYAKDGNHETPIFCRIDFAEWKKKKNEAATNERLNQLLKEAEEAQDAEPDDQVALRSVPRIKDRVIRFNTKHPTTKQKIKHRAIILSGHQSPHLERYINSVDGETSIGRQVNLEMIYAEEREIIINGRKKSMVKVVCSEVKQKQDTYIDYEFFLTDVTKQEAEQTQFYKGTVGGLRLSSLEEQKLSGACCIGSIFNVQQVTDSDNDSIGYEAANEATLVH